MNHTCHFHKDKKNVNVAILAYNSRKPNERKRYLLYSWLFLGEHETQLLTSFGRDRGKCLDKNRQSIPYVERNLCVLYLWNICRASQKPNRMGCAVARKNSRKRLCRRKRQGSIDNGALYDDYTQNCRNWGKTLHSLNGFYALLQVDPFTGFTLQFYNCPSVIRRFEYNATWSNETYRDTCKDKTEMTRWRFRNILIRNGWRVIPRLIFEFLLYSTRWSVWTWKVQ